MFQCFGRISASVLSLLLTPTVFCDFGQETELKSDTFLFFPRKLFILSHFALLCLMLDKCALMSFPSPIVIWIGRFWFDAIPPMHTRHNHHLTNSISYAALMHGIFSHKQPGIHNMNCISGCTDETFIFH